MKEISDLFVINPSINVSPYCYSVFRVEPYQTCEHKCVYCFGRWYRTSNEDKNEPMLKTLRAFRKIIKILKKRQLRTIPFRLSTLVDPFQPIEEQYKVSRHIMNLSLKYDVPLIINTKAILLTKDDYFTILRKLSDREIVIVQISLSVLNDKIAKILEPRAPLPYERIDMAEFLSREGIPVIIRLQPFIPGITDHELKSIIELSRYAGVKQIIVEALRDEYENIKFYGELAYNKQLYRRLEAWSSYSPSVEVQSKILRPNVDWRTNTFALAGKICNKYGLEFSTCKEGFYELNTAKNCCGMHFINESKYVLRPTLWEAWNYYKKHNKIPKFEELTENLAGNYVFGDVLKYYPRILRKKMMGHEKILRQILDERRKELSVLLPSIFKAD